jgi:hypothetical protein
VKSRFRYWKRKRQEINKFADRRNDAIHARADVGLSP